MVKQVIASAQITLTDLGDAIISGTKPTNPKLDQLWIERKSGVPDKLWRWNGTAWIEQTLDLSALDPDADGKIENHETTIGNMVDDAKIDITERQEVKNKLTPIIGQSVADNLSSLPTAAQLWTNGVGEVFTIRKAAQNVGIKTDETVYVTVETAYNSLQTYLNGMTPKPWDASVTNKDKPITVVPTDWRTKWLDYFKAVQALTVAIQTKLQGNIENIKINSRNILLNTVDYVNDGTWRWQATTVLNEYYKGTKIAEAATDWASMDYVFSTLGQRGIVKVGDEVTMSVSARLVGDDTATRDLKFYHDGNPKSGTIVGTVTKNWQRFSITMNVVDTMLKDTYSARFEVYEINNTPIKLQTAEYTLNFGNKDAGWTPAIEDIDKAIKDADKKAQDVTNSVNDMSLDSKLTPVEKIQLKTDWEIIQSEFNTTLTQADAFNLTSSSERANFNTAYTALKNVVEPLLMKMNETSNVDRTVFRQRFKDYYDTKARLLKKISDTSKGLIDAIDVSGRNLLNGTSTATTAIGENRTNQTWTPYLFAAGNSKAINDAESFCMSFDWVIEGTPAGTLYIQGNNPYPAITSTITFSATNKSGHYSGTGKIPSGTALFTGINFRLDNLPLGSKITISNVKLETGNKPTGWTPSPEDVNKMVSDVDKKAEESKSAISDMSSDSKLTPLEKVQLKKEWGTIAAEKPQFETLGKSYYNASSELNAYINAYNTLNNTLNGTTGYLKNMASTDTINGATFRAQFDTYYAKQAELIKKVNNIIQGNIDGIQSTRNIILNSKRAISVNDYLLNDYKLTEDFIAGQDYTFVVKGSVPSGQRFGIWQNGGSSNVGYAEVEFIQGSGIYYVTFKAIATTAGNQRSLRLYNVPQNTTSATVEWVALYKGTKPFDWSAAPEDSDTGKTNLIVDSEFKYLTSWILPNASFYKTETGIMPNGVKNVTLSINSTDGTNKYADFTQYIEVEPNTEYTFSCNAGGTFQIFLWEKKADKTATNVYKDNPKSYSGISWDMSSPRETFTRTIKTQPDAKYIQFIFRVQSNTTTYVSGRLALPKLERGTTASEWTANPFDSSNGEIFLQGSATDITDRNRKLTVNGNVIYDSIDGRGLRLVTLKKDTLAVVDDITYDVYGSDVPRNDLATKINSLGNDVFITLSSCDAINFNTNLLTALVSIGASGTILQGRLPYAFIGMKGLGRYNGLEQWTGLGNVFPPATISCKVVNGMIQGVNNNNGQSDTNVRKDLRLNAPLPTSILMDSNGITASGTDASKYARLDYRGLYIAGGAIQIDGGLTEGQLASGVTRKMSYLDSNGLYTGQVNIGGSGQNGILSIKNASNSEIVRGDTNGLTINSGAITIKRPDGANLIINGLAAYNFAVTTHQPPFRGGNIDTRSWYYHTTQGLNFNRDLQVCDYIATQHTGRYMKMEVDFYADAGNAGALVIVQAGKYNSAGQEVIVSQTEISQTKPQPSYTITIDCGVPTYQRIGFYFCLASWTAGSVYARLVRPWMEG